MTYSANESGLQTSKPVELYEFTNGPQVYRYTSADEDITYQSKVYESRVMSRNSIEATQEMARGALNITCERTLPLLDLFKFAPPSEVVTLLVRRIHRGDTEAATIWMGRILNISWRGLESVIHCESVYTSIKRTGLRRMYQKQCPHVLYSPQCGIDKTAYGITRTVQSISGLGITLDAMGSFAVGYFAGGYIEWEFSQDQVERRAIRDHSGAVITVNFPVLGLSAGAQLIVYPGCDHTLATCNGKFSNVANYGGMPYIPAKNPFDGTPIY
jgi:uncharacterized phage protein (TIGR02218 family)